MLLLPAGRRRTGPGGSRARRACEVRLIGTGSMGTPASSKKWPPPPRRLPSDLRTDLRGRRSKMGGCFLIFTAEDRILKMGGVLRSSASLRPVRLLRVSISGGWLKQTLNSKGWEFSCLYNFIGSLSESLTHGLLVGKLLVGGLGIIDCSIMYYNTMCCNITWYDTIQ